MATPRYRMREDCHDLKKGDLVFLARRYGFQANRPDNFIVGKTKAGYGISVHKSLLVLVTEAYDVEGNLISAGDQIARFNTTDNIQILERREVLYADANGIMMAPKTLNGRPTATGNFDQVLKVNR